MNRRKLFGIAVLAAFLPWGARAKGSVQDKDPQRQGWVEKRIGWNRIARGVGDIFVDGLDFRADRERDTLHWSSGSVTFALKHEVYGRRPGSMWRSHLNAGKARYEGLRVFVYWPYGGVALHVTTSADEAFARDNCVFAVYHGGTHYVVDNGRTTIDGNILTLGGIDADQLADARLIVD